MLKDGIDAEGFAVGEDDLRTVLTKKQLAISLDFIYSELKS